MRQAGYPLSSRDRTTLIGGAIGIALIVAASRGIPVWREWDDRTHESAVSSMAELSTLLTDLRRLPALRDSARVRAAQSDGDRERLIEAATVAVAGAQLATRVTDMADDLGLKVGAITIRPDSVFRADFAVVAVTLSAEGDVTHLTDLLTSIETNDELLAVRDLTISPADVLVADGRQETLRFQIQVEGLAVRSRSDTAEK